MGIVKISDALHEEVRDASAVMARSINSQAEYWIKIGMLAEFYPELTYAQLTRKLLLSEELPLAALRSECRSECRVESQSGSASEQANTPDTTTINTQQEAS